MSEFIVWDNKFKKFYDPCDEILLSTKSNKLKGINGGCGFCEEWTAFACVGKKDINNKKIYADCSIVEFDLKQNHPLEIYSKECGVFKYSNETLSYYIDLLNGNSLGFGRWERVKDIKIIDTIQENKLNLIK